MCVVRTLPYADVMSLTVMSVGPGDWHLEMKSELWDLVFGPSAFPTP